MTTFAYLSLRDSSSFYLSSPNTFSLSLFLFLPLWLSYCFQWHGRFFLSWRYHSVDFFPRRIICTSDSQHHCSVREGKGSLAAKPLPRHGKQTHNYSLYFPLPTFFALSSRLIIFISLTVSLPTSSYTFPSVFWSTSLSLSLLPLSLSYYLSVSLSLSLSFSLFPFSLSLFSLSLSLSFTLSLSLTLSFPILSLPFILSLSLFPFSLSLIPFFNIRWSTVR